MSSRIIFIPTVQHTGTWFMIDLFRCHPMVNNEVVQFCNMLQGTEEPQENGKWNILQTHIGSVQGTNPADARKHQHPCILNAMIGEYGASIPLRDPLLSMITRHQRHPNLDHRYIVNGFMYLASLVMIGKEPAFLPVDIEPPIRLAKLGQEKMARNLFAGYGLDYPPDVDEYVHQWRPPQYNVTGTSQLKQAYLEGNTQFIKSVIPKEWAYLCQHEATLRPFLETNHYRELIWWKK